MNEVSDFLEHYGVKGMRWGVRKSRNRVSPGRTVYSKTPNRLSDQELKSRIARLEAEKKYRDLNAPEMSAGKVYVKKLMETSGKTAVSTVVGGVIGGVTTFAVQRMLKKKFGVN